MLVSVILPTYNRFGSLTTTLSSLARQTLPVGQYEVIVVDDGSTDATAHATFEAWPWVRVIHQPNAGGIVARQAAVDNARGDVLVFLDDDMTVAPGYLQALLAAHADGAHRLCRGALDAWVPDRPTPFARTRPEASLEPQCQSGGRVSASPRLFASNNMSIRGGDFRELGGWLDLAPFETELRGGIWADLEFAVRAQQAGFALDTVCDARIVHRDYAIVDLDTARKRAERVSALAPMALSACPWLAEYLPMYRDMTPIDRHVDPHRLLARKLLRRLVSHATATEALAQSASVIERWAPGSPLLPHLYRWIIGGHHYRGFRVGLDRLAATGSQR